MKFLYTAHITKSHGGLQFYSQSKHDCAVQGGSESENEILKPVTICKVMPKLENVDGFAKCDFLVVGY